MNRRQSTFGSAILLILSTVVALLPSTDRQAAAQSNVALLAKICDAKDIKGSECLNAKNYEVGETCNVKLTPQRYRGKFLSPSTSISIIRYESECAKQSMHSKWGGVAVFENRGNNLEFQGYHPGLVPEGCAVVPRDSQHDRLICEFLSWGHGYFHSAIVEIIFSRDASNKLSLNEDALLVEATSSVGALLAEKVECKDQFARFGVGKPRPGPAPDTASIEVDFANAQDIKRACAPIARPPKDAILDRLQLGEAYLNSRTQKGRFIIDLKTKEIVEEAGYRKRR